VTVYEYDSCRICGASFAVHSIGQMRRCVNMLEIGVQNAIRRDVEAQERAVLRDRLGVVTRRGK
jgi:hypothetical protein